MITRNFMTALIAASALIGCMPAAAGNHGSPAATIDLGLRGVHFVPNRGQWDNAITFGLRSPGIDVGFRASSLSMHMRRDNTLRTSGCRHIERSDAIKHAGSPGFEEVETLTLTVSFPGSLVGAG